MTLMPLRRPRAATPFCCLALTMGLVCADPAHAAVVIDGELNEPEWQAAQRFSDFREVQPLSGDAIPDQFKTEAWLLSTPEGIAVAMRVAQPESVARVAPRIQRDFREQVDRANFIIDFDADGRAAYDFAISAANDIADDIITQENQFNNDWDGQWQHAVQVDAEGYRYEWLIPWSIASMKAGQDGKREAAVYFDRVIASTGQRFATPVASFSKPRFVSDFTRISIDSHQAKLFAITPYAVVSSDFVRASQDFKAGVDLFWKPNANHQFAATLNPDFGQVESDQLVVNFDNIEVFFNDKRPFFTENQAAFEAGFPGGNLFYTRRVGSGADDGSGAADIRAALKGTGNVGDFGYGFFLADETGEAGRTFALARGSHQSPNHTLVAMQTHVDRPALDRVAGVTAINSRWKPNEEWQVNSAIHYSQSDTGGVDQSGVGGGVIVDWDMPGPWRQQYFAIRVDDTDNVNDMGFQDRNNFRYFEWETGYRIDSLPAESSFASHAWELELVDTHNLQGYPLRGTLTAQQYSETRDGGNVFGFVRYQRPVYDDLISRGNGVVRIDGGWRAFIERFRPRRDGRITDWYFNLDAGSSRVDGGSFVSAGFSPTFHPSDQLDVQVGLFGFVQPNWLLWQGGTHLGTFAQKRLDLSANLNWFINDKQELRVKLQNIAIDAKAKRSYDLQDDGQLSASVKPLEDFAVRNLGFQVRYRYKLGPLSDVYAVYGRGGFALDEHPGGDAFGQLFDAFELRDDDQFLIKVAYRFEP